MKKLIIIALLLLPVQSFALDEWSKTDIALQAVYTTLHVIDWGQTLSATNNPDKYHETNVILGKYPSRANINYYMGTTLLLHTAATALMPEKYRVWFQAITIGVEGFSVITNYNIGIKASF